MSVTSPRRFALTLLGFLVTAGLACAADWEATTTDQIIKEKPGYGGLSGVVVDHTTGVVYVNLSDRGVFRSKDQGKTWEHVGKEFKGRTEQPGCLLLDPTGKSKRLVCATVYGDPIAVLGPDDENWRFLDKKTSHLDWCAVDWTDPEMKFILALKHESGGTLVASTDGGKSFAEIGKGYGPAWVFDSNTAVVAETKTKNKPIPCLSRTIDGGKTFKSCGDYVTAALPKFHDGTLYWLVDGALIKTTDAGKSWAKVSELKGGLYGPIFGKDAKQLFVLTSAGVVESKDGGATWSQPLAVPKELKGVSSLTWFDYDPQHDVYYVMKMGSDLYRMERAKK